MIIPKTFNFISKESSIVLSDEELAVTVMVLADGYFPKDKKICRVNVKKSRKKERCRMLLKAANIPFTEYTHGDGYTRFSFVAPIHGLKQYTWDFTNLTSHQRNIVLEEVFHWDGSIPTKGTKRYFTTNKTDADIIQFIISSLGYTSGISIDKRENKPVCYTVSCSSVKKQGSTLSGGGERGSVKFLPVGKKETFCFTVPSGYLVLRRDNKIFVTGNSGKDTVADIIVDNSNFEKYSLADPIKAFINELFGLDERHSDGCLKEVVLPLDYPTYNRAIMVCYKHFSEYLTEVKVEEVVSELIKIMNSCKGSKNTTTGLIDKLVIASPRQLYQWFGTDVIRKHVSDSFWLDIVDTSKDLVIADIRFDNEAEFVRKYGQLIHIERENREEVSSHVSEKGISSIKKEDIVISNRGSLEELEKSVIDTFKTVKEGLC